MHNAKSLHGNLCFLAYHLQSLYQQTNAHHFFQPIRVLFQVDGDFPLRPYVLLLLPGDVLAPRLLCALLLASIFLRQNVVV
ncbi:Uncharacterised protein [Vibrio cholerae]|nr:Uncharacterised protein [Vibrio cholerae]CSB48253.1 Uncharacterised protein [Vibrio cholerae]CSD65931.1 Uncharacterised protein [Vibrio cholerae]